MKIKYGRQDVTKDDIAAVVDVLKSDLLTQGPIVPKFEKAVSGYTGASHAVAVNSATSALHIACMALDVSEGDIVWTSPISFVASSNCALYCNATIDFVDIDPLTNNISIQALKNKLEQAKINNLLPKVVIPVHLAGLSCDMLEIFTLSKKYNFKIIEDASHAVGGVYNDHKVGSCKYSDFSVFSFHPVKIIATGEGGALLTNNSELASKAKLFRSHGITKDPYDFKRKNSADWYYEQHELGYNYRMTDIQAALGLSQIQRLDKFLKKRLDIFNSYLSMLNNLPITLPEKSHGILSSNHLFIIKLNINEAEISHHDFFHSLKQNGIGVNIHYIPIYRQPFYQERFNFQTDSFPNSEDYYSRAISLPIFVDLKKSELNFICETIKKLF